VRPRTGGLLLFAATLALSACGRNAGTPTVLPSPGVTSIEATAGAQFSASKLMWELGTLEPNTSRKVRVSYMPTREGELMATATVSANCADTVADSTRTIVTGIATSRLDLIDVEDPVEVGTTTTYVVTVSNEGSAPDRNVRVSCVLDERLQYVSCAGATAGSIMGKTVSFSPLSTLEPKAKATWRVVVKGTRAGDVLFKATMYTGELTLPVEATEATLGGFSPPASRLVLHDGLPNCLRVVVVPFGLRE